MAKIYKSLEESSKKLSKGQKIREQECQHCELGVKIENCQNCIFATLSDCDMENPDNNSKLTGRNHKKNG